MQQIISKSQFKMQVLEYLRNVEKNKQPLIITHVGKPVVKIVPYKDVDKLNSLRNTVVYYKDPMEPVAKGSWEALK
jgi:prevent-host-death family protein